MIDLTRNSAKSHVKKVKFFFVGVGKCGTSWQFSFLSRHRPIATPAIKEPYLIDAEPKNREKMVKTLYKNFETLDMSDFSTVYYWDPDNPRKIFDYNVDAKIIFTTRLPSARIVSHFGFLRRSGITEEAEVSDYLRLGDPDSIVDRSDYRVFLSRYVDVFGPNSVLLLPLELLETDPQAYADRMLDFLQVSRIVLDEQDRCVVLKAAEARNRLLARIAKGIANSLRHLGALRLLGYLKNTKIIHKILYQPAAVPTQKPSFGEATERIAMLDDDYPVLLREHGVELQA